MVSISIRPSRYSHEHFKGIRNKYS
jgi:hypothetical protein